MWPDIFTAAIRFILLTEFYFLVEICLCLGCVINRYNFILGSYLDCTHESDKINKSLFPVVHIHTTSCEWCIEVESLSDGHGTVWRNII